MGKQAVQSESRSSNLLIDHATESIAKTKIRRSKECRSKDTLDIKSTPSPLKSCILIPNPDGSGEKVNVKKSRSVHFADSLGKPLKSIKTLYDFEDELDNALLGLRFQQTNVAKIRHTFPVTDVLTKNLRNIQKQGSTTGSKFVNFEQPILDDSFIAQVKSSKVFLESVIFREYGIFGTVAVHNIAYEKSVFVNYTIDNWTTVQTADAKYVPGSNTGVMDTFSFEINTAEKDRNDEEIEIKFAICYISEGVYWDSNDGKNYCVLFRKYKCDKLQESSSSSSNCNGFIISKHKFIGWAS